MFRWTAAGATRLAQAMRLALNNIPPFWTGGPEKLAAVRAVAAGGAFEVRVPA